MQEINENRKDQMVELMMKKERQMKKHSKSLMAEKEVEQVMKLKDME